jgi:hypothetical protein
MILKLSFALVAVSLSIARLVEAGPGDPGKGYVQAGVMMTEQRAGIPNHRVTPGLGGSAIGLVAGGGVWLTPTVAVEGEFVGGRAVSTPQQFWYDWSEDFTGESRDLLFGANVRVRPAPIAPVELFGGGGLVISTFAERSIVATYMFPPRTSTQPDQVDTQMGLTVNGGLAVAVPAGSRIDVVPAFMVRWTQRPSTGLGDYLGVGSFAYQFGATVRFKID